MLLLIMSQTTLKVRELHLYLVTSMLHRFILEGSLGTDTIITQSPNVELKRFLKHFSAFITQITNFRYSPIPLETFLKSN